MKRFGRIGEATTNSSVVLLPVRMVLNPERFRNLNVWWMLGRRISASTRSTFPPFCASTIAVLMLVVVLPSCGKALVTIITLGAEPIEDSNIDVRRARYDSATSDLGRAWARRLILVF